MSWLLLLIVPLLCQACPDCQQATTRDCWNVQCNADGQSATVRTKEGLLTVGGRWLLIKSSCLPEGQTCQQNAGKWSADCIAAGEGRLESGWLVFDVPFSEASVAIRENAGSVTGSVIEQNFVVCNNVAPASQTDIVTTPPFKLKVTCCLTVSVTDSAAQYPAPIADLITLECNDTSKFTIINVDANGEAITTPSKYFFGDRLYFQVEQIRPNKTGQTRLDVDSCWVEDKDKNRIDLTRAGCQGTPDLFKLQGFGTHATAVGPDCSQLYFYDFQFDAFVFSTDYEEYTKGTNTGPFPIWVYCAVKAIPNLTHNGRVLLPGADDLPEEEISFGPILVAL